MARDLIRPRRRAALFTGLALALLLGSAAVSTAPAGAADIPPKLVPGWERVTEGDAGTTVVEIPFTLSRTTDTAVTATWQTIAGPNIKPPNPATPGDDFTATGGTLTIPAGQTTALLPVTIHGDSTPEADETIVIALTNLTGATPGGFYGLGFATIEDDDTPPMVLTTGTARITEGDVGTSILAIPIVLSKPTDLPVSVDWRTRLENTSCAGVPLPRSCATPNVDYLATSATTTFAPGETTAFLEITIVGDTTPETDEILYTLLTSATNAELPELRSPAAFIEDDD